MEVKQLREEEAENIQKMDSTPTQILPIVDHQKIILGEVPKLVSAEFEKTSAASKPLSDSPDLGHVTATPDSLQRSDSPFTAKVREYSGEGDFQFIEPVGDTDTKKMDDILKRILPQMLKCMEDMSPFQTKMSDDELANLLKVASVSSYSYFQVH